MKGSELLRTLAIAAASKSSKAVSGSSQVSYVPVTSEEAEELLRIADELDKDQNAIKKWLIKNVHVLPRIAEGDEGNDHALLYNLVHLLTNGPDFKQYNYEPEQDVEIKQWLEAAGIDPS